MYIYIYIYNHSAVLHAELLKNRKTGMQSQTVLVLLVVLAHGFASKDCGGTLQKYRGWLFSILYKRKMTII